jgi:hypothetical protein
MAVQDTGRHTLFCGVLAFLFGHKNDCTREREMNLLHRITKEGNYEPQCERRSIPG